MQRTLILQLEVNIHLKPNTKLKEVAILQFFPPSGLSNRVHQVVFRGIASGPASLGKFPGGCRGSKLAVQK